MNEWAMKEHVEMMEQKVKLKRKKIKSHQFNQPLSRQQATKKKKVKYVK